MPRPSCPLLCRFLFCVMLVGLPMGAQAAGWWPFGKEAASGRVETAPPVTEAELATIPGEKRMEYEGQCTAQAVDRAKEMGVETEAFLAANRDYLNHCIMNRAHYAGLAPAAQPAP